MDSVAAEYKMKRDEQQKQFDRNHSMNVAAELTHALVLQVRELPVLYSFDNIMDIYKSFYKEISTIKQIQSRDTI